MLYPQLEERLHNTKRTLDEANPENIIEQCKQYLSLLAEYRSELYKLPDNFDLNPKASPSSLEDVESLRKAVRAAIEDLTQEHNSTAALLLSFTAVSGYGAVETFNSRNYRGHDDWELSSGGVKHSGNLDAEKMTIQEAVGVASLLRREAHIARRASVSESIWSR
jgi:hypothetical protein